MLDAVLQRIRCAAESCTHGEHLAIHNHHLPHWTFKMPKHNATIDLQRQQ
jgi:hypothetical protein